MAVMSGLRAALGTGMFSAVWLRGSAYTVASFRRPKAREDHRGHPTLLEKTIMASVFSEQLEFSRETTNALGSLFIGSGGDPKHPLANPLYTDYSGFSSIYKQVGGAETLLDDSRRITAGPCRPEPRPGWIFSRRCSMSFKSWREPHPKPTTPSTEWRGGFVRNQVLHDLPMIEYPTSRRHHEFYTVRRDAGQKHCRRS